MGSEGAPEGPTILYRDDTLCVAHAGDVLFELWLGRGDARRYAILREQHEALLGKRNGRKMAVFGLVRSLSLTGMSDDMRAELARRARAVRPHMFASVVVLEQEGFVNAVVRSVLAGLTRLDRSVTYPSRVCATIDEGVAWLVPHLPKDRGAVEPSALRAALERALAAPASH